MSNELIFLSILIGVQFIVLFHAMLTITMLAKDLRSLREALYKTVEINALRDTSTHESLVTILKVLRLINDRSEEAKTSKDNGRTS